VEQDKCETTLQDVLPPHGEIGFSRASAGRGKNEPPILCFSSDAGLFSNQNFTKKGPCYLLSGSPGTTVKTMKINVEERSRYKITDSHRNQTYVAIIRKNRDNYAWTWQGHIDFTDGHNLEFASRRSFSSATEAEDYMRRFACARIDSRLNSA